jgi:hypothetical protein
MLGVNITLKDAEKMAEGRKLELDIDKERILTNFRNAIEFNRSNVAEGYVELDGTVLLHLNKIMLTGWKDSWEVKFRESGEGIDARWEDWLHFIDQTIFPEMVIPQTSELLEWYHSTRGKLSDVIRVSILCLRLLEISPFAAGNKYTILALWDLLLYQYGYISGAQVPIIRIFDQHEQSFWKVWEIAQKSRDLTPWLESFAAVLYREIVTAKGDIDHLLSEEQSKNTAQPFLDLNKRQLKILRYLQNIPSVKREDYCQMMDVSTMTAFRDLNDLVRKKLLKVDGQGRGTKYLLVSR